MGRYQPRGVPRATSFEPEDAFKRNVKTESSNADFNFNIGYDTNGQCPSNVKREPERGSFKAEPKVKSEDAIGY